MTLLRHACLKYIVFIAIAILLVFTFSPSHFLPFQLPAPAAKPEKQPTISKAIVAAARATEDVSWMSEIGDG